MAYEQWRARSLISRRVLLGNGQPNTRSVWLSDFPTNPREPTSTVRTVVFHPRVRNMFAKRAYRACFRLYAFSMHSSAGTVSSSKTMRRPFSDHITPSGRSFDEMISAGMIVADSAPASDGRSNTQRHFFAPDSNCPAALDERSLGGADSPLRSHTCSTGALFADRTHR